MVLLSYLDPLRNISPRCDPDTMSTPSQAVFGYMNMGIALALITAARGKGQTMITLAGTAHFAVYILAFVFRSTRLGMLIRDAVAFKVCLTIGVADEAGPWSILL